MTTLPIQFHRMFRPVLGGLLTGLLLVSPIAVQAQASDTLAPMEQKLFARDYASESLEERLSRMENVLFGQKQTGDTDYRQSQLEQVLTRQTVNRDAGDGESTGHTGNRTTQIPQKNSDATDYPTVSQMEERLFQRSYENEHIARRLARLEQQVFKQTYDEIPMVDRVDQLTLKVLPENPLIEEEKTGNGLPPTGAKFAPSNFAVYSQLTSLEENVLGKTYGGELIGNRMDRLEKTLFGSAQSGTIDHRMDRLMIQYAKRYRQNRASVGTPQPYTPNVPYQPQTSANEAMVQGQAFSPEFLSMLPAHVRQRIEARGMGSVAGAQPQVQTQQMQVYSGPGVWTHNQTTIPYGFQIQQRSFSNTPGTVPYINPNVFPGGVNPAMPQTGVMMPYMANPLANYLQTITILETQVFGQAYPNRPLLTRLNELEQQVFGRTYPQFSYQQRINRLQSQTGFRSSILPDPGTSGTSVLRNILGNVLYNTLNNQVAYPDPSQYYPAW